MECGDRMFVGAAAAPAGMMFVGAAAAAAVADIMLAGAADMIIGGSGCI